MIPSEPTPNDPKPTPCLSELRFLTRVPCEAVDDDAKTCVLFGLVFSYVVFADVFGVMGREKMAHERKEIPSENWMDFVFPYLVLCLRLLRLRLEHSELRSLKMCLAQ